MKNRKPSSDSTVKEQQESAMSSALYGSNPQRTGCLVICVSLLTIDVAPLHSFFFKKEDILDLKRYGAVWCTVSFSLARANLVQDETQPSYKNITGRFIVPPVSADSAEHLLYPHHTFFPFYLALYFSVAGSWAYSLQRLRRTRRWKKKKRSLLSSITPLARAWA